MRATHQLSFSLFCHLGIDVDQAEGRNFCAAVLEADARRCAALTFFLLSLSLSPLSPRTHERAASFDRAPRRRRPLIRRRRARRMRGHVREHIDIRNFLCSLSVSLSAVCLPRNSRMRTAKVASLSLSLYHSFSRRQKDGELSFSVDGTRSSAEKWPR